MKTKGKTMMYKQMTNKAKNKVVAAIKGIKAKAVSHRQQIVLALGCVAVTVASYGIGVHAEPTNVVENANNIVRPLLKSALVLGTMIGGGTLLIKRKFTWAITFFGVMLLAGLFIVNPDLLINWLNSITTSLLGG